MSDKIVVYEIEKEKSAADVGLKTEEKATTTVEHTTQPVPQPASTSTQSSESQTYEDVLAEIEAELVKKNQAILELKDKLLVLMEERTNVLQKYYTHKEKYLVAIINHLKTKK